MKRFRMISGDVKAVVLLLLFVVIGLAMIVFSSDNSGKADTAAADSTAIRNFKKHPFQRQKQDADSLSEPYYGSGRPHRELFPFDPNTADSTALLRLGLMPWQVRNIYKYRAAGGIYRKKEDFARLYGLTVEHYRALEPFIRISSDYLPASTLVKDSVYKRDTLLYPLKLKPSERIVLNTADTTTLKKVPGIGSGYARQIKSLEERLGGFVSVDQLDEIDGFPSESKQYFVIQDPITRRMNLNTMSLSKMKRHPYMGFHRAEAIVNYRQRYGRIDSLEQLRLSKDFPPEVINRLKPYVEY